MGGGGGEVIVDELDAGGANAAADLRDGDELVLVGGLDVRNNYAAAVGAMRTAAAAAAAARDARDAANMPTLVISALKGSALGELPGLLQPYVRLSLHDADAAGEALLD